MYVSAISAELAVPEEHSTRGESLRRFARPAGARSRTNERLGAESEARSMSTILERVARGEANAVQECIDRYGALVYSLARRFAANAHDVEDAVQETFLQLWKLAPRYESARCAEATFVAMIARRRLIDMKRRAQSRGSVDELPDAVESTERAHDERIEICDDATKAREALNSLKPDQKRVLELSIYDGLSHQEIATKIGLPLGTVKTHARRGLERVRELLGFARSERASEVTP